jgi:hypothetical protein
MSSMKRLRAAGAVDVDISRVLHDTLKGLEAELAAAVHQSSLSTSIVRVVSSEDCR